MATRATRDTPPFHVIAYCAKSTEDTRDSLRSQLAEIQRTLTNEGRVLLAHYSDESASGFRSKRDDGLRGSGLATARVDAERLARSEGHAELWVFHSNRLARGDAREASHLAEHQAWAIRNNVSIRSVSDDHVFRHGFMGVGMAGDANLAFSTALSAAVSRGKNDQLSRGEVLGGPVPDGFIRTVERDHADRILVRHYSHCPTRYPIIRELFALAEQGYGDTEIAKRLNLAGHRTQSGNAWIRRRVQDTILNPVYAGFVTRFRNTHREERVSASNLEPIIEVARYEAIVAARSTRDRIAISGSADARIPGPGRTATRYALAKLAVCGRCGSKVYTSTSTYVRKNGTRARSYVCANVKFDTALCDAPRINAEAVDAALLPHLSDFFADYGMWTATIRAANSREQSEVEARLAAAKADLERLRTSIDRAHVRYKQALAEDKDDAAEAILDALATFTAEQRTLRDRRDDLRRAFEDLATRTQPTDGLLSYWQGIADSIRGRIEDAESLNLVNAELRHVLDRVTLDTLAEPEGETACVITPYAKGDRLLGHIVDWNHEKQGVPITVPDPEGGWTVLMPDGESWGISEHVGFASITDGLDLSGPTLVGFSPGPNSDLSGNGNDTQE